MDDSLSKSTILFIIVICCLVEIIYHYYIYNKHIVSSKKVYKPNIDLRDPITYTILADIISFILCVIVILHYFFGIKTFDNIFEKVTNFNNVIMHNTRLTR